MYSHYEINKKNSDPAQDTLLEYETRHMNLYIWMHFLTVELGFLSAYHFSRKLLLIYQIHDEIEPVKQRWI